MSRFRAFKYLPSLLLAFTAGIAFALRGPWSFLPLVYGYLMVPLLELFIPPNSHNMSKVEEDLAKNDPLYDWMVYLTVPVQVGLLIAFLFVIGDPALMWWETAGLIGSMGLLCGTYGINVGHELGHRVKKHERFLAKTSLLTSLYMHFYIEHNRGHHKHVSTEADPASARYGEAVYAFWLRSVRDGYLSAWKLEAQRLNKKNLPVLSLRNEMLRFQVIQFGVVVAIGLLFSWTVALYFVLAAISGFLTLETVNYIEHYGLQREKTQSGNYERVQPHHSWNSNHVIGRLMLFELSRHSDHHYMASRKYQILKDFPDAPQMPTGYPGMMLLSLVPPIWFRVMHREIAMNTEAQGHRELAI